MISWFIYLQLESEFSYYSPFSAKYFIAFYFKLFNSINPMKKLTNKHF